MRENTIGFDTWVRIVAVELMLAVAHVATWPVREYQETAKIWQGGNSNDRFMLLIVLGGILLATVLPFIVGLMDGG